MKPSVAPVATATPKPEAGTLLISAVGLIDPSDPRYGNDKALLQSDLRADSRSQLVEKAVAYEHDGTKLSGFLVYDDAKAGPRPGVLVVHEWWGLNDYTKNRARQLASMVRAGWVSKKSPPRRQARGRRSPRCQHARPGIKPPSGTA